MTVVLASKSPRRRELMRLVLPRFETAVPAVDEAAATAATPAALAEALALHKAQAVFAAHPAAAVVGCDTVVELDGRVLGKPRDEAEAAAMLGALSGRRHLVHTGVCICVPGMQTPAAVFTETSAVHFWPLPAGEIAAYVRTGEAYDKAGGYGIQGWAARYIPRIEGCYYNVMGLPVAALHRALRALGLVPEVTP